MEFGLGVVVAVVLTALIIIGIIDMFSVWKLDALDKEYRANIPKRKKSDCPICGQWMDISKTQKVIVTKNGPEMCCIWHKSRELVDYFKKVQSEVSEDAKEE